MMSKAIRIGLRLVVGTVLVVCLASIVIGSCTSRRQEEACTAAEKVPEGSGSGVSTNVVEVTREVVVTNTVTVTVTNVVEVAPPEAPLSARRTAPYVVESDVLSGEKLRAAVSECGARFIDVKRVSSAVVEASTNAVEKLRGAGFFTVRKLGAAEKLGSVGTDGKVLVYPVSAIDATAVAEAVRACGAAPEEKLVEGRAAIAAELRYEDMLKLAERGDVRRIEWEK